MYSDVVPVITDAGRELMGAGNSHHVQLDFTHCILGNECYQPEVSDTEIRGNFKSVPLLDYDSGGGIITVQFLWDDPEPGDVGAVVIYSNDTLFCVYSTPEGVLFSKAKGDRRLIPFDLRFDMATFEQIKVLGVKINPTTIGVAAELARIGDNNLDAYTKIQKLEKRIYDLELIVDQLKVRR